MKPRAVAIRISLAIVATGVVTVAGLAGAKIGRQALRNELCCQIPRVRSFVLSIEEMLHLVRFPSQLGQDKWVAEAIFPGARDAFFLDVGSGDGTLLSNTKALEQRGWMGICIDPFPTNMQGRTCQLFREVVFSKSGARVSFRMAGEVGGIVDKLGRWKNETEAAKTVEFTTVTLADILDRAKAPRFIHFVSLDIEGAEYEALLGFPFERYRIGALDVEHNFEEPKRSLIRALMKNRGYKRVNSWEQDDFFLPNESPLPER